jgi:hypothetical protein
MGVLMGKRIHGLRYVFFFFFVFSVKIKSQWRSLICSYSLLEYRSFTLQDTGFSFLTWF